MLILLLLNKILDSSVVQQIEVWLVPVSGWYGTYLNTSWYASVQMNQRKKEG